MWIRLRRNSVWGLKTMWSGLISEKWGNSESGKRSFNCIRTGSEWAGAIMARKAGSDYNREVKGLVMRKVHREQDRLTERRNKNYERYWKCRKWEIMEQMEKVRKVGVIRTINSWSCLFPGNMPVIDAQCGHHFDQQLSCFKATGCIVLS